MPKGRKIKPVQSKQSKQITTASAVLVGILFLIVAVLYWTQSAGHLPAFLPGYAAGSLDHHTKHGILALALAICSFVAARFFWGPSKDLAA